MDRSTKRIIKANVLLGLALYVSSYVWLSTQRRYVNYFPGNI